MSQSKSDTVLMDPPPTLSLKGGGVKVIVCGGRDFRKSYLIWKELDRLHNEHQFYQLMQGGATGVDFFAKQWAIARRIQHFEMKAEWDKYGLSACPMRNARMLQWKPDLVIAFPGRRGTADMIRQASAAGVQVIKVLQAVDK